MHDGDQIIAEYDASGILLRKYIYGTGIDEPIALVTRDQSTEASYYYHFDGLGSVTDIIDSSGAVIEKYSYDVYGKTTIKDANDNILLQSAIGDRFAFTGREYDSETGLYYYRARMYSSKLGRFLQTDPLEYYDSINLYNYCWSNPTNFVDSLGLQGRGGPAPLQLTSGQNESYSPYAEAAAFESYVYGEHNRIYYGGELGAQLAFIDNSIYAAENYMYFGSGDSRTGFYTVINKDLLDYKKSPYDDPHFGGIGAGFFIGPTAAYGKGEWEGEFTVINTPIASFFGSDNWKGVTLSPLKTIGITGGTVVYIKQDDDNEGKCEK